MQSPASPATRAFAVHDYNLSFHEGSRHRLKRHGVQQLGPEILPLRLPELILLDGGSWQPAEPAPIKSLKEVSGFRDVLTDHASVRTAITRIFQESKPEPQVQMAYLTRALRERSDLGEALWRSLHRQRVLVCAPTKEYYVMIPGDQLSTSQTPGG